MLSLLAFVLKLFLGALLGGFLEFSSDAKNQRSNVTAAAFIGLSAAALLHVVSVIVEVNQGLALGLGIFTCVWLALNVTPGEGYERRSVLVSIAISGALVGAAHILVAIVYAVVAKVIFYAGARYFSDSAGNDETNLM